MRMLPRMKPFYRSSALILLALTAALSGCASNKLAKNDNATEPSGVQVTGNSSNLFGFLKPYRIDIQQGNFVSREMVAQLKPGMTREQVRFVLGTPLLTDVFHADRWDYEFRLAKGNGQIMTSRVSAFFKDNLLERYEGGSDLPTEQEYLSLIAGTRGGSIPETSTTAPVAPLINNK